jgi:DNA-binding MarR family transcriptional regulator
MSLKKSEETTSNKEKNNCCDTAPAPEDFNGIFRLVYKINKRIENIQRNTVQEIKITPAQYLMLRQLWNKDGQNQTELAKECLCSKSTVTGIIDTMEKNKLIRRVDNPKDRRKKIIKLTAKGKEYKKVSPQVDNLINNCCQGFDEFDLKMLGGLLQKLFNSLKTLKVKLK